MTDLLVLRKGAEPPAPAGARVMARVRLDDDTRWPDLRPVEGASACSVLHFPSAAAADAYAPGGDARVYRVERSSYPSAFLGAAAVLTAVLGALLGALAYRERGWRAGCAGAGAAALVALVVHLVRATREQIPRGSLAYLMLLLLAVTSTLFLLGASLLDRLNAWTVGGLCVALVAVAAYAAVCVRRVGQRTAAFDGRAGRLRRELGRLSPEAWPTVGEIDVARRGNLRAPMAVVTCNTRRKCARYEPATEKCVSGEEAYDGRYANGLIMDLLWQGTDFVYIGGKCTPRDRAGPGWEDLSVIRYPERRGALAFWDSDTYWAAAPHRTAGLKRAWWAVGAPRD